MRTRWVALGALGLTFGCGGGGSGSGGEQPEDGGMGSSSSSGGGTSSSGGAGAESDLSSPSDRKPPMDSSDESQGENTSGKAQSGTSDSASDTGDIDLGSGGDTEAGSQSSVSSEPVRSSDGGQSTLDSAASSSTEACSGGCETDAVRCVDGEQGLTVERCVAGDAGACPVWSPVDGCEGAACLSELITDSCDPGSDEARCEAGAMQICAPGASGCPVWRGPTDAMLTDGNWDIDEGATEFTGYGVLSLKLTANVDAGELVACLRDTRDVATEADSPAVESVSAEGDGEYELQLSRYHLPVAYELSVAVGSPPVVRTTVLAPDVKSRVAFISKTKGNGDLASWTAEEDTPLEAADSVCQADAEAAGLAGTFKAYLSIGDQTDAICRLRGGEGLLDEGCGLDEALSEEQLTAPFLDMKGLPIAYGTKDIEQGLWRLPVGYEVDGVRSAVAAASWTGTALAGEFARYDCSAWSGAEDSVRGDAYGSPGTTIPQTVYSLKCDGMNSLTCFSSGESGNPLVRAHERSGHLAYVIELPIGSQVDISEADIACQNASGKQGVVAWFSSEDDDAVCRVAGLGGKASNDCGLALPGSLNGPWVRSDGYLLAERLDELVSGLLRAPLTLAEDGAFSLPTEQAELVRTDTLHDGTRGGLISALPCINGDRFSADGGWSYNSSTCPTGGGFRAFVYCFEL